MLNYMSKTRELALVALSLLAWALYNNPILSIFNRLSFKWRIPVLYMGIFGIWFLIIVVTFLIVNNTNNHHSDE